MKAQSCRLGPYSHGWQHSWKRALTQRNLELPLQLLIVEDGIWNLRGANSLRTFVRREFAMKVTAKILAQARLAAAKIILNTCTLLHRPHCQMTIGILM